MIAFFNGCGGRKYYLALPEVEFNFSLQFILFGDIFRTARYRSTEACDYMMAFVVEK